MEKIDLGPLLAPKSIAVVGVSKGRSLGGRVIDNLLKVGYRGRIYPINPKYEEVKGMRCYPNVTSIEQPVDLVMIALASSYVLPVMTEAAGMGVRAAVIPSSGFGETGDQGRDLEKEILRIATGAHMAVCGPNCYGVLNLHARVAAFSGPMYDPLLCGHIGIVMQSGALTHSLTDPFTQRGVGLSYLISSGNETVVSGSDYIEYMIEDDQTTVIATFVEGFRNVDAFIQAAERAQEREKPIVVLKVGRSQKAQKAALAHTGSLAGSDEIFDALFKQKGIIRVKDLDELIETTIALSKLNKGLGRRIGVVTISGGVSSLISDLAEEAKVSLPDLNRKTIRNLRGILPSFGTPSNPLDCTGGAAADLAIFKNSLECLSRDSNIDLVAVGLNSPKGTIENESRLYEGMASSAMEMRQIITDKPFVIFTFTSGDLNPKICQMAQQTDIPVLQGLRESILALSHAISYSEFLSHRRISGAERSQTLPHPKWKWKSEHRTFSEHEAKRVLSCYGLDCIEEALARSREETICAAQRLGYPVVLKVLSPDIPHKTEAKVIWTNLGSKEELMKAYDDVMENAMAFNPEAMIQGVLVQRMVTEGVETILGIKNDPQVGPVLVFGLGGIFVELLRDFSLRIPPLTENDALSMVREIRGAKLLEGLRGRPRSDIGAIVRNLLRLSEFAMEHRNVLSEVDINPFIVFEEGRGALALDALITIKEVQEG